MKTSALLTLVLPFVGVVAFAQNSLDSHDSNHDGNISKDEWHSSANKAGMFKKWDTDGDGYVSAVEYDAHEMDDDMTTWDTNMDSRLDNDEFNDGWFGFFDDNEDGHWDGDEWDDAGDEGLFDI